MTPQSCIYEGRVRHRRYRPAPHGFEYSLYMMYLDLDELPGLFDGRWLWSARGFNLAWFRRVDHVADAARPLADTIRDLVERQTGRRPGGPIRLLTHLRYFGYVFNPVSFYYCFDAAGTRVETIVAEVSNTPWNEMHCYVLPISPGEPEARYQRFRFRKDFHVSPFMDMDFEYDWRFGTPGDALFVHMENLKDGGKFFDATMWLRRRPISGPALARVLLRYPLMTVRVISAIYWQALRLHLKRCPVHTHPKWSAAPPAAAADPPAAGASDAPLSVNAKLPQQLRRQ